MRIKELEDVLVLVDAMPKERQLRLARLLMMQVEDWEAQTAEGVGDREWLTIRDERITEECQRVREKLERQMKGRRG